jgi:hypothetical protein
MEKYGRLRKPEGKKRWSYADAMKALAVYARKDEASLLQMHPVDYIIQYLNAMEIKKLLPKEVVKYYNGPFATPGYGAFFLG